MMTSPRLSLNSLTVILCGRPQCSQSEPLEMQQLLEMANSGKLEENCAPVSGVVPGMSGDVSKLIFVFKALRFGLALFERSQSGSHSSYSEIGSVEVAGLPSSTIGSMEHAAAELVKAIQSRKSGPTVEISVDGVSVYEVREFRCSLLDLFSTSRSRNLRLKKHTGKPSKRWRVSRWIALHYRGPGIFLCLPLLIFSETYQVRISSSNVVSLDPSFAGEGTELLGVITRRRKLKLEFCLFEHKPGSYEFAGSSFVETSSDQRAQVIWDSIRRYIASHQEYGKDTGHRIQVYKVRGSNFPSRALLISHSPRTHLRLYTTKRIPAA